MSIFTCIILQAVPQSSGGYGGIILLLTLAAAISIIFIKSFLKVSETTHKQGTGKNTDPHQSNSFYVEDDGTIVRGIKEDGKSNTNNSIVVKKLNEQKEAILVLVR